VGTKTTEKLLTHFKSVDNIRNAQMDELEDVVGKDKAKRVSVFFLSQG
jgi:excinuclease ABC subunit C